MNRFMVSIAWCGVALASAGGGEPLTLGAALARAREASPGLAAADAAVRAAEAGLGLAGRRPNPSLSLEAEDFGGEASHNEFDAAEFTVALEQPLELGGQRAARQAAAAAELNLEQVRRRQAAFRLEVETAGRFLEALAAQERLAASEERVAVAGAFARAVASKVQAGKVSPLEEARAQAARLEEEARREGARGAWAAARAALAALWGGGTGDVEAVAGDLLALPEADPGTPCEDLAHAPGVAEAAAEVETRAAAVERARAGRYEGVAVGAGLRRYAESDEFAWTAGVSIPLPVFDRQSGRVAEASAKAEEARHRRLAAEQEARAMRAAARLRYAGQRQAAGVIRERVLPALKSALDAARLGYEQGKFSYLEVLDAQRSYSEARESLVEAAYEAQRLALASAAATGRPVMAFQSGGIQ